MEKIIKVFINEIIGNDLEGFLELLEERCEAGVLENIEYEVIGEKNGGIILKVIADVSQEMQANV